MHSKLHARKGPGYTRMITFRKAPFLYRHVIGHNYATIQQFKESRDKKNYLNDVISGIPGINMLPRVSCSAFYSAASAIRSTRCD